LKNRSLNREKLYEQIRQGRHARAKLDCPLEAEAKEEKKQAKLARAVEKKIQQLDDAVRQEASLHSKRTVLHWFHLSSLLRGACCVVRSIALSPPPLMPAVGRL
jgi:hypothetical protein